MVKQFTMTTPSAPAKVIHKKISLEEATLHALAGPWHEVFAPLGDRLSGEGSLLGWVPSVRINGVEICADGFEFNRGERFWLMLAEARPLSEKKMVRENWTRQLVFVTGALSHFAAGRKEVGVVTHCGADLSTDRTIVSYEMDDGMLFRAHGSEVLIYPSDESPSAIAFTSSSDEIIKRTSGARVRWMK